MNKRIQELEEQYNNITLKKRFIANAAVLSPDVSGVISETYKFLDELHKKLYQEIQDLKQEDQALQDLLESITKRPNINAEKAMEEDISSESYDSVEDIFSQIFNTKKECTQNLPDITIKAEDGKTAVYLIADILQNEADRTGEKVLCQISTCELIFSDVFYPKKSTSKE